jgi:peptidyl-prolyl cis-trans isomerase C
MSQELWRFGCLGVLTVAVGLLATEQALARPRRGGTAQPKVLVVVNRHSITSEDLERLMKSRRVTDEYRSIVEPKFLHELIDLQLIGDFLAKRETSASGRDVDQEINRIKQLAHKNGDEGESFLKDLGYTEAALRKEIALQLAWQQHAERTITSVRLHEYFNQHRQELDGTKIHVKQIVLKIPTDDPAGADATEARLQQIRQQILEKAFSFEEAARKFSETPSGAKGGDLGLISWNGRMPDGFAEVAFNLKVGELSPVFRTQYGVHLCVVVDRQRGDLSLEDVRKEVQSQMARQLWIDTAAAERKTATIEWKITPPDGAHSSAGPRPSLPN